jgi:hypothetical protein
LDRTFSDGKSIRQETDWGKEKNREEGKGVEGFVFTLQAGIERPFFGRRFLRISIGYLSNTNFIG